MTDIERVREYDGYTVVWFKDGRKKTYIVAPESVEDFKYWCSEKGVSYRVGQATEYAADPEFRTL